MQYVLERTISKATTDRGVPVWRMRVEVSVPNGQTHDPAVFLFRRRFGSGQTYLDEFQAVAAAPDISTIGTQPPTTSADDRLFRRNDVELDFRLQSELDEAWEFIRSDIDELSRSLHRLTNNPLGAETFTVGQV